MRKYPYGSLGRRAIGLVNNNAENENKSHYGLEGRFEYVLHGTPGYEWMREADGAYLVHNFDSSSLAPKNGQDVHFEKKIFSMKNGKINKPLKTQFN